MYVLQNLFGFVLAHFELQSVMLAQHAMLTKVNLADLLFAKELLFLHDL